MTEGFEGSEKDIGAVGEDVYGVSEGIEGVPQGQMEIGEERVLRPRGCRVADWSGGERL